MKLTGSLVVSSHVQRHRGPWNDSFSCFRKQTNKQQFLGHVLLFDFMF